MNWSSSGFDAFTISTPVLQRIRPVTHRSVDKATTKRTTEPIQSAEATENVIRFHREGILRAHGAPRQEPQCALGDHHKFIPQFKKKERKRKEKKKHHKLLPPLCSINV